MTPWTRPNFVSTGRHAAVMLVAFADRDVLNGEAPDVKAPRSAPVASLDLRMHAHGDKPEWFDGFRTGAMRNTAAMSLADVSRLDQASFCYTVGIGLDDPQDLTHLQLAWSVATSLCRRGCHTVLDGHAITWHDGERVAALDPDRPFAIWDEVGIVAEHPATPGFGHVLHTRGMLKFGAARSDNRCAH